MIAKTKIKTGGVNTSDAAIIVYKNTKEELPLVGLEKILYLVIPTSELYIWTGNAYCKINGVLEETLSDLAENFKNTSELSSTEFAALSAKIDQLDVATLLKFIDTYAEIETAASTLEALRQELNETLNILSNDIQTYKAESQKELNDLAQALDAAESNLNDLDNNMTSFMSDGVFDTAEIAAIGLLYNLINLSFSSLNTEYDEVVSKIESIIESNNPEDITAYINDEFPALNTMKSIWKNPQKDVFIDSNTITSLIFAINDNTKSFSDFNLHSLFQFILELCLYITKDKLATSEEVNIWNEANDYISALLNDFQTALRSTTAAIALLDAEDEIKEALGSVNQTMNGLLELIDGLIINWNDKGFPLPLYDHSKNKWFNGSEWVDTVQTEHKGPSLNWVDKYDLHINDTYVDLTTGSAYRWCNTDVGYHWCKIADTATEEVLRKAAELEGALDRKTTTFLLGYPTHPYHKGDLWIVHTNYEGYKKGEILNCITDSVDLFKIRDWSRECIYTDDSKADLLYADMLEKLDTKFNDTIDKINSANSAINTLGQSINSRPTIAELNQAIKDASDEIKEDILESLQIIDIAFADNKITPIEKLALLAELREICGYLFDVESNKIKLFNATWANHNYDSTAFKNLFLETTDSNIRWFNYALINYYYNTKKINFHEQGSYASIIRLKLKDIDFTTQWYNFLNDQNKFSLIHSNELNDLSVKLQNLFDLFNSLNIGNLNETTTIQADSTTKQQLTQAFTDYYNQELAIIKLILDEVAASAAQDAKDYSDTQLSVTNTKLNSLFSDGVLTPSEKNNILYKIYLMFDQPALAWSETCLLLKEGSGTNAGLSIVSLQNNTSTRYSFINWIGNCTANCDFVNTCNKIMYYFPQLNDSSGIWGNSLNIDFKVIALRDSIEKLRKLFILENGNCKINLIMGAMELFSKEATTLDNPTEFLEWCEIFEKQLNLVKFNFLEYRLSQLDMQT